MAKVMRSELLSIVTMVLFSFFMAVMFVSAERSMKLQLPADQLHEASAFVNGKQQLSNLSDYILKATDFLWQSDQSGYQHVWPEMKFGWRIVLGTIIGAFGAAFGSVGGIGGGGIFVPMLTLVIGFDPKSSTALSKCMIMGAAILTVYYNLKKRHPTIDIPIIDYDLVLLIQPMLMLGISIGVAFSVVFADWMVTVLLIIIFLGTSVKAFFKGIETWKKETILKKEIATVLESGSTSTGQVEYKPLVSGPNDPQDNTKRLEVTILENLYWKEIGLLFFVWVAYLVLQIAKNYTTNCSAEYWLLNLLQVPVSVGVYLYEAISLYKGRRVIASKGDQGTNWQIGKLVSISACGFLAGIVGGLLGIGGGFIMGPLFLELGIPPQVASATATFGMTFSSSMSVVEYYLLNRFPVPYALYLIAISAIAAYIGQSVMDRVVNIFGRASLIIFVLSFTIFVSALSLGGVGISNMVGKINRDEYMGFEDLCKYGGIGRENMTHSTNRFRHFFESQPHRMHLKFIYARVSPSLKEIYYPKIVNVVAFSKRYRTTLKIMSSENVSVNNYPKL